MTRVTLLAVPNVSEGLDHERVAQIARAFAGEGETTVRLLDTHTDPDHHRSVFTLAGAPGELARAVLAGARQALARVDISRHAGAHPRVGALDVAPIVHLREDDRGAASAEALVLGDLLGEQLGLPVFLYGALGGGRTRGELRRGGPERLAVRIAAGELVPDFGPHAIHRTAGAVLVAARPPLVAFNVELAPPASLDLAREVAAAIREGGPEGLASVRAMGVWLTERETAQVSTNIEDHHATSLGDVVAAIGRHAEVSAAELVGLAPRAALDDFAPEIPFTGRATIEDALQASD